jgi:hypothetical protein
LGYGSLSRSDRSSIERQIKILLNDIDGDSGSSTSNTSTLTNSGESGNVIHGFLGSIGKRSSDRSSETITLSIREEIANYRSLASKEYSEIVENGKEPNAIRFWQTNAPHLTSLYGLAKKYLASPATSVPSESAFSVASHIGRKQRARLSPQNLAMSVFLKDKVDHVDHEN